MSKAVIGAAEIAGAVAIAAATGGVGGIAALAMLQGGTGLLGAVGTSLFLGGIAAEAGAIAQALGSNQGMGVTTRQPASYRQIIRGMRRVGGTIVYQSTTGSSKRQYNLVIVLAGHPCHAITDLYLDGRRVIWQAGSHGQITMADGTVFGGFADPGTYYGPNGVKYSFGSEVFCVAHMGAQTAATIDNSDLFNNDPTWAPSAEGTPYLGGCTWVYLKLEADSGTFPQFPEIRFTVKGKKDIYDPRTGTRGYSENWALHIADAITDPTVGLGDPTVNMDQLIAAANVCDELVSTAQGSEARYALHWNYTTSIAPGAAIDQMMAGAAGRLARVGGEWFIYPAYWQGPAFAFDESVLIDALEWSPRRAVSDLFNRVTGTYIAPNFPYNVSGDLYDSHGYWDGLTANNFPFAYQPTNFPPYACDALHGFGSDVYLQADTPNRGAYDAATAYAAGDVVIYSAGLWQALQATTGNAPGAGSAYWAAAGNYLPHDIELPCVLSITQAQRIAKITLLRNRQQGSGKMIASLGAWAMQPADVMAFSMPSLSWLNKTLELVGVTFKYGVVGQKQDAAPGFYLELEVHETDASVYEWTPATDELTAYDVPANPDGATSTVVPPPTGLAIEDDSSTQITTTAGVVIPRLLVVWVPPLDNAVNNGGRIEVQYRFTTAAGDPAPPATLSPTDNGDGTYTTAWIDAGAASGQATSMYVQGVAPYARMSARVRAVRSNGGASVWVEVDGYSYGRSYGNPVAPAGTLTAVALSDGTAQINIANFTTVPVGGLTRNCTPSPAYIAGENQGQIYNVYYVDPNFAGGTITPIATQTPSDYLGKTGYFLIGTIRTPTFSVRYQPTSFSDVGSSTTQTPSAAYDGDMTTSAAVTGMWGTNSNGGSPPTFSYWSSSGQCIWGGFQKITIGSAMTLHIIATATAGGTGPWSGGISATIAGTTTLLVSFLGSVAQTDYTIAIPSGTDLSTVTVSIAASITEGSSPGGGQMIVADCEIYIA